MHDCDLTWRGLAESSKGALALLGYPTPPCLPHDPEPCGANYAEHATAQLAALAAVVDHHLIHLGAPELAAATYSSVVADLHAGCDLHGAEP